MFTVSAGQAAETARGMWKKYAEDKQPVGAETLGEVATLGLSIFVAGTSAKSFGMNGNKLKGMAVKEKLGGDGGSTSLTIMSRNSSHGNPNAIIHFGAELNTRQNKLLKQLPNYDSSIIVRKSDVNLNDLSSLTAKTGDEFAMFTRGSQRLIIRGGPTNVNIDGARAQELFEAGYKWSGHTHPGAGG